MVNTVRTVEVAANTDVLRGFEELSRDRNQRFDLRWHSLSGVRYTATFSDGYLKDLAWDTPGWAAASERQDARFPFDLGQREVLGSLRLPFHPEDPSGRLTLPFNPVTVPRGHEVTSAFLEQAAQAAHLIPTDWWNVVRCIAGEHEDRPAFLWLVFLFCQSADPVAYRVNGKWRYRRVLTLHTPILDSISAIRLISMSEQSMESGSGQDAWIETLAMNLEGIGQSRFRYLAKNRNITFSEFMEAEDPTTGQRLTRSTRIDSIQAMLRKLSGKLEALTEGHISIRCSRDENSIRMTISDGFRT